MQEIIFRNLNIGDIVIFNCKQSPDYGREFKLEKFVKVDEGSYRWRNATIEEFRNGKCYGFFIPIDGEKVHVSYDMKIAKLYEEVIGIGRRIKYTNAILKEQA